MAAVWVAEGAGVEVGVGTTDGEALVVVGVVGVAEREGAAVGEVRAAAGGWSVGSAVAPPTAVSASAIPNAPAAQARLGRRAQATRPRTRATTATTKT